jgi:hypothetical protein
MASSLNDQRLPIFTALGNSPRLAITCAVRSGTPIIAATSSTKMRSLLMLSFACCKHPSNKRRPPLRAAKLFSNACAAI